MITPVLAAGIRRWHAFIPKRAMRHGGSELSKQGHGQADKIVAIHALRWLAASLIVFVHSEQELAKLATHHHSVLRVDSPVDFGIGVDIFFVISGFLIHHLSRYNFRSPGFSANFLRRRLIRVVPLYWLATTGMLVAVVSVPGAISHNHLEPIHVIMSYLMIAWPDQGGAVFPVLSLGWTLNLEIYFYGLFALALLFREQLGITLLATYLTVTVMLAQFWQGSAWPLQFYGKPVVLEFVGGIALSILYARGFRIKARLAFGLAALAVIAHLVLWNVMPIFNTGRLVEKGLPAGLLFFACVFVDRPVSRSPASRLTWLMGNASYALYLTSPFAINVVAEALSRFGAVPPSIVVSAAVMVSMGVAIIVFYWVERPMTRFGKRLLIPPRRIKPPARSLTSDPGAATATRQ